MRIFQSKAAPTKPGSEVKAPSSSPAQAPRQQNPNSQGKQKPQRQPPQIITKREDIPFHVAILSSSGGALELPEEWQKDYAILLVNREKKEVEVVCSTEIIKRGVNDDLLTIVDQIKRNGYVRVNKWIAKPEMISIIYESTENQKSREEQERTATKIQIEFDDLITQAMNADVSDIHIEVRRDEAKVRFRKNGDLFDFIPWSVRYARVMAGVIYQVIADEKDTTFDEFKPQDAIIDRDLGDKGRIRIRLATIPAYPSGFDMIMRILKMGVSGKRRSLESLGYNKVQLSNTRRAVAKPVGAVVMAGTTGSGKSTSLNSMLSEKIEHYGGRIKVITVEDPPEYLLLNATQVPVVRSRSQAKAGDATVNPFASVVRAAMRSDPDILMVGEVRDPDSAELLIHAVQSGHQVFTTTHASSGIDVVSRLRSNHVPDDVLGSQNFLSALMYQTLLPSLCPHCSIGVAEFAKSVDNEKDFEMLQRIFKYLKPKDASALRFKRDGGCPHCVDGVTGRSVAAEVILPDPHMLKCFRERRETDALLHYRHKGGKIALDHGLYKALQGICDLRDVEHKLDQMKLIEELDVATRISMNIEESKEPFKINLEMLAGEDGFTDSFSEKEARDHFIGTFLEYLEERIDQDGRIILSHDAEQSQAEPPISLEKAGMIENDIASSGTTIDAAVVDDSTKFVEIESIEVSEPQTMTAVIEADSDKDDQHSEISETAAELVVATPELFESFEVVERTQESDFVVMPAAEVDVTPQLSVESDPLLAPVDKDGDEPGPEVVIAELTGNDPVRESSDSADQLVLRAPSIADQVTRLAEIVNLSLSDELSRNGLTLTPKFLFARASEAGLLAILRNDSLDTALRNELKGLIEADGVMEMLKTLDAAGLYALINHKEEPASHKFKSRLLGGDQPEKITRSKPGAKVRSLETARAKRGKPEDKKNDGNDDNRED
jgi:type II secretory ATPase GspE/PulE/Tfp pilus assembly ATPase PilB-like protein